MEKLLSYLGNKNIIICLLTTSLVISMFFNFDEDCVDDVIEITIPEKEGKFDPIENPEPDKKENEGNSSTNYPSNKPKSKYNYEIKWDTIEVENPLNLKLVNQLNNMTDSVQLLKAYINAISINNYTQPFEDEFMKATVKVTTTGTLDKLSLDYKIKEKKVPADIPVRKTNKILIGAAVGNEIGKDIILKPTFRGDLNYQTNKGNIYSIEYYSNKNLFIGYKTVLFK